MTNYRSIAKSFIWVSVIFVFSKILGFGREMTLAATFGASFETDAFFVAIIIPTIIFANVFGTLQATVIPVYTRIKNYEPEEAAKLATALFYGTVMISLVFIFLGFNFTTYIVKMLAPSFTGETFLLTVKLARIMIFAVPFIALKSLATALLQYHNSFLIPATAGIPYSIILIIATLCFGHKYGVAAVAIALILGYLCQLLIQVPQLLKLKVFDNNIILYHPGMKEIVVLTIPVLLGIIGNELNLIVDRILASGLTEDVYKRQVYAILSKEIENLRVWRELPLEDLVLLKTYSNKVNYITNTILFKLAGLSKLKRKFENIKISVVYVPMIQPWSNLINSIFKDSQIIVTAHDPKPHSGTGYIYKKICKKCAVEADDIVILSNSFREYTEKLLSLIHILQLMLLVLKERA